MKSGLVSRGPPRSRTTMERPVSASSLARMPPVQPSPTMTMSADLSFDAMALLAQLSVVDLTFASVSQRVLKGECQIQNHTRILYLPSVPLVLTFVNEPAAIRY